MKRGIGKRHPVGIGYIFLPLNINNFYISSLKKKIKSLPIENINFRSFLRDRLKF